MSSLSGAPNSLRRTCCACGLSVEGPFFRLERRPDGSFAHFSAGCTLHISEVLFRINDAICSACMELDARQLGLVHCDVCKRLCSRAQLRFGVERRDGVTYIGHNVCLIFKGPIETGLCCYRCNTRNTRLIARRRRDAERRSATNDQSSAAEPLAKRPCPVPLRSPLSSSPPLIASVNEHPQAPALHEPLDADGVSRMLDAVRAAKSDTEAAMRTVDGFLSMRERMCELMGLAAQEIFDIQHFAALQARFLEMLMADGRLIDADYAFYTDELQHSAVSKSKGA